MEYQIGDKIAFHHISNLTGKKITLKGTVEGFGDAVRKFWKIECSEAPDECYLVKRFDVNGNIDYHMVMPEDVVHISYVYDINLIISLSCNREFGSQEELKDFLKNQIESDGEIGSILLDYKVLDKYEDET